MSFLSSGRIRYKRIGKKKPLGQRGSGFTPKGSMPPIIQAKNAFCPLHRIGVGQGLLHPDNINKIRLKVAVATTKGGVDIHYKFCPKCHAQFPYKNENVSKGTRVSLENTPVPDYPGSPSV